MGGADHELRPGEHFAGHRIDRAVGRRTYRASVDGDVVALRLGPGAPIPVEHPNAVPVLWTGSGFSVTAWIEGTDLSTLLAPGGGLEPGHVLAIAGQVAAALDAAHARGVTHGGVKPARILLAGDHAWLANFGIPSGTDDYLAPERPSGPAADVYALGCVIWEALTGRPPHLFGDSAHVRELRPELPDALDAVLERRWPSAGALVRAARAALFPG
jgi:serine/threonine protein kinase